MGSAASVANSIGQKTRAVGFYEKIRVMDPMNIPSLRGLGALYLRVGRYEDAIEVSEQILSISPDYPQGHLDLANAYLLQGEYEAAMAEVDKNKPHAFVPYVKARILFRQGRDAEAQIIVNQLLETTAQDLSVGMAGVYAEGGDLDAAFAWLEIAYQKRLFFLAYILNNMWMDNLKGDPRYPAFLEKMGLREYWEAMPAEYGGPQA